jgi:hypothetical protein
MAPSKYRKISEASEIDSLTLEEGETEEPLSHAPPRGKLFRNLPGWAYAIIGLSLVIVGFAAGLFIDLDIDRKCLIRNSYYCGWPVPIATPKPHSENGDN